jgi:hypothetical protein
MEPVTPLGAAVAISALAGKAWDIGRYIHNVYQGSKTVDTRIKKLSSEVHGLASTCDLVHAGLAHVLTGAATDETDRPYDHDGTLEKSICAQVAHCQSTLRELGKIAERLWPRKKKFVDRTVRELRLQDAKEQIDDLRARIRSHTDALHTVLLVLSIKVAHFSPGQALSRLPDDLGDLRESIVRIEAKLERPSMREGNVDRDMPALVEYARCTLRHGTTLFNDSLAGSTVGVDSVVAGEQAAVTNKTVAEWILSAEQTGHEHRNALPTQPKHSVDGNAYASDCLKTTNGEPDCDSDDEQVEFAMVAMEAGHCAYGKHDWQSASKLFAASKKTISQLPVNRRDLDTLLDLQYWIARCSYYLGLVDNAESELQGLLQLEPESDKQRVWKCDAHHLLALTYVHQNKLDAAKHVCKRTSNARSRLLGKQHEDRLYSIALLSRICKLLGEEVESKVYSSMIPEEQRERLTMVMSVVQPSNANKAASSTPIKTQAQSAGAVERQDVLTACATDSNRYPRETVPTIPTAGSKDRVSSAPIVQKPSPSPTTDPSRTASIPNTSPKVRDLQKNAAAQPEPSKRISVLDATLPNRSTKSTCPPQAEQPTAQKKQKKRL